MKRMRHKVVSQLRRRGVTDFSEEEFFSLSRIQKRDFERLCAALQIPDEIRTQRRDNFTAPDALFITLRRLVYPCRLVDLSELFGRSEAAISSCLDSIYGSTSVWKVGASAEIRKQSLQSSKFASICRSNSGGRITNKSLHRFYRRHATSYVPSNSYATCNLQWTQTRAWIEVSSDNDFN